MIDALEHHERTISTGGRVITNLRFADDIDGLQKAAGMEEELAKLAENLDKACTAYGMEMSVEKTTLMINNTSGITTEIRVNGQKLERVTSFKRLGSHVTDEGSKPERLLDSIDDSSIDKVETGLERQKRFSKFQDTTDALPCHIRLPVCL